MFDLKVLQSTLEQIETEKNIPREKILEAIEFSLAAAYKKDYGAKGQVIRSHFNPETGDLEFFQVKSVVDDTLVKPALSEEQLADPNYTEEPGELDAEGNPVDIRVRFNVEHHMYLPDAKRMRAEVKLEDEIVFPLDNPLDDNEEFGRVAAMTAKQVIMQKLREAEKDIKLARYEKMLGTVITGTIQKVVGGKVFVELAPRTIGVIDRPDQPKGEWYKPGDRIKVYLEKVEPGTRGVRITLSRTSPEIIRELFKTESPEVATGIVEIKAIAREPGARTKMAVHSNDPDVDPIGACVGQRGSRINAVTSDLGEEKIDIIVWSDDPLLYVANALAPAQVIDIEGGIDSREAKVVVAEDQLSLAIGKEGQNARLAAKLTGWKIDISGTNDDPDLIKETTKEEVETDDFVSLDNLKGAIEKAQSEVVVEEKQD
ncbi:MAG: N utilization substance protein A [Crocinitomicaceae bacterium]|jgi:N utilization substance protein A